MNLQNLDLTIIVAVDLNSAIGVNNKLPWHMPADLKRFKKITSNSTVIMGRKTFESIGKPLPNRTNIIITRQTNYNATGCTVCASLEDSILTATKLSKNNIFILGGADVFKQALPYCNKIELTIIETKVENADTYFPKINLQEWNKISDLPHSADEQNPYSYRFVTYKRMK